MGEPQGPAPRGTGVSFPQVDGHRSTTATGRAVFAAAVRVIEPDLAERIAQDDTWRKSYVAHVRALCAAETRDPDAARFVPAAGLSALHERFTFVHDDAELPLGTALREVEAEALGTVTVDGREAAERSLAVPYRGEELRDGALSDQLDRWTDSGAVEPSFAEAIRRVQANPDWLELDGRTITLLGAGAELGPLAPLCRWGATVALVDIPRPDIWQRILTIVHSGAGRAHIPVRTPVESDPPDADLAAAAGADLLTDTPVLWRWLRRLEGPLTVGNYVYADGADNTRVAMAVDAITAALLEERDDLSLAMLATPTDVFAAPAEAVGASRAAFDRGGRRAFPRLARTVSGNRLYAPNYEGTIDDPEGRSFGIADAVVVQQGPNYLLAKRLQRWRARDARGAGVRVSANVAPATRTRSVTKNRLLASAYAGAHRFDVEVFEPDTANTLMAAALVHDLCHDGGVADPTVTLDHPLDLFAETAAHGGLWRIPYAPRSVLPIAAIAGFPRT